MEATIVPQLLAEIDGVETLKNVIVIGASNREDLIDPASATRPSRREDQDQPARRDVGRADLHPVPDGRPAPRPAEVESLGGGDPNKATQAMIERTVDEMYRTDEANQFLEVTYQNGDKRRCTSRTSAPEP